MGKLLFYKALRAKKRWNCQTWECGSKKNPIDSLKLAGVDLTKKEVVESALNMFNETIEEFKKLTDE